MVRARGDIGIDAFLNVCKEPGATSHDVVARARRLFGSRRIGHAGTLDPSAEGVLPLAIGRATRLIDRLAEAEKEYYAEAVLGVRTSTDDGEGEVVERRPVPPIGADMVDTALAEFHGEIEQRPPAFSALKVGGRRAYDLARSGREVTLAPRRVTIYRIERCFWQPPVLGFSVRCSKGTYVRSLARDLGERLGPGASLRRLVRLRVGPFRLEQAATIADLEADPHGWLVPPDLPLLDGPAIVLGPAEREHLRHGRGWPAAARGQAVRGYTRAGDLAAVLDEAAGRWWPRIKFVD